MTDEDKLLNDAVPLEDKASLQEFADVFSRSKNSSDDLLRILHHAYRSGRIRGKQEGIDYATAKFKEVQELIRSKKGT